MTTLRLIISGDMALLRRILLEDMASLRRIISEDLALLRRRGHGFASKHNVRGHDLGTRHILSEDLASLSHPLMILLGLFALLTYTLSSCASTAHFFSPAPDVC